jgi:CRISPR-associated endoribonuclease Cas6/Csy4 subtype I-F
MHPVSHYADIRVTGDGVPQIVGILVTRLHGFMASRGTRVAVAFPRYREGERPKIGEVLRVFGDESVLNDLLDDLDGDPRERWMCGRVKPTPEYERVAVYSRVALPRRPDIAKWSLLVHGEYKVKHRMRRRMEMLESMKTLPYFFVRSTSGQRDFPFTVSKKTMKKGTVENGNGPNAYGMSRKTVVFAVPEF